MKITEQQAVEAMVECGGSFVKALGAAWQRADPTNAEILRNAFPALLATYKQAAAAKLAKRAAIDAKEEADLLDYCFYGRGNKAAKRAAALAKPVTQ